MKAMLVALLMVVAGPAFAVRYYNLSINSNADYATPAALCYFYHPTATIIEYNASAYCAYGATSYLIFEDDNGNLSPLTWSEYQSLFGEPEPEPEEPGTGPTNVINWNSTAHMVQLIFYAFLVGLFFTGVKHGDRLV